MKGGDILDFQKGGNLRKGGGGLSRKGGMTNYACHVLQTTITYFNIIPIEQIVIFKVFWEVFVQESQKYFTNVGLRAGVKQWIKP